MTDLQRRAANYERLVIDKMKSAGDVLQNLAQKGKLTAAEVDRIIGPMKEVASELIAIVQAAMKRLDAEALSLADCQIPALWSGTRIEGL